MGMDPVHAFSQNRLGHGLGNPDQGLHILETMADFLNVEGVGILAQFQPHAGQVLHPVLPAQLDDPSGHLPNI